MLSSLPNLADRPFIVGFLVPALVLLLSIALLFADLPLMQSWLSAAAGASGLESILSAVLFVWFVAIGLMMVNRPLMQMLEGYHGPLADARLLGRKQQKFAELTVERTALAAEWRHKGDAFPAASKERHDDVAMQLALDYPGETRFVLPTRLGNVIRSFEDYPRRAYGADSIALWPHIVSVADAGFLAVVEDARSQVTCLVNLATIGLLLALLAVARLVVFDGSFVYLPEGSDAFVLVGSANYLFVLVALACCLASWLAYLMAIERARGWGGLVRAAFDRYLPALGDVLGLDPNAGLAARRAFWEAMSRRLLYMRPITDSQWQGFAKSRRPPALPEDSV